jgi:hypothetical protein
MGRHLTESDGFLQALVLTRKSFTTQNALLGRIRLFPAMAKEF